MRWFGNVAGRAAGGSVAGSALARRLRRLERFFDVPRVRADAYGAHEVAQYYEQCFDAYRKYHSPAGAVHMALNEDGRFDAAGFHGQLRRMEADWAAPGRTPPRDVLELAFGQGFNLGDLAPRHPGIRFEGIDLTPTHLRLAQQRLDALGVRNATLRLGDFHALPYADECFDEAFCIEAFCYARDARQALQGVARVLRPGGRFVLFDGYLPRPPSALAPDEALAVELVAKGMAIPALQVVDELLAAAREAGFEVERVDDLDRLVLPSLARLERLTAAIIRVPWLGRRALARRAPARSRNVLAGYLMHTTVVMGLIGYRHIVLRKVGAGGSTS